MRLIQDGRFSEYLRVLFGSKQTEQMTGLPDIMPVVQVAGERPEDAYLRGDKLFMTCQSNGPVAGQYSQCWLEMSPLSVGDWMAVIERIDIVEPSGAGLFASISLMPALAIGSLGSSIFPRDGRIANAQGAHCKAYVGNGSNAVPSASTASLIVSAGQDVTEPIVVGPGSRLYIEGGAVNQQLQVSWFWRETRLPTR